MFLLYHFFFFFQYDSGKRISSHLLESYALKTFVSNVDSLDWKELTEEEMKKRIFDKVQNGSILLFHNGTPQTAAALPGILQALKDQGYEFVRVSDLIYKEHYTIDHTGRQFAK